MNNLVKDFLVLKMGRIFQKKFILKNLIRRSTYINSDVDSRVAGGARAHPPPPGIWEDQKE